MIGGGKRSSGLIDADLWKILLESESRVVWWAG
jgi:hypothetical protein